MHSSRMRTGRSLSVGGGGGVVWKKNQKKKSKKILGGYLFPTAIHLPRQTPSWADTPPGLSTPPGTKYTPWD